MAGSGVATTGSALSADADPNLPRTNWNTFPPHSLQTYRQAYHLSTPSSYTHPHGDIIFTSSPTALRSPSSVVARRKLRELKAARRKDQTANKTSSKNQTDLAEAVVKQPLPSLALAVRRHFNSASVSESEVIAKFLYTTRNSGSGGLLRSVPTEGSNGDGEGWVMGSQGRAVRADGGGDVGFRLRFRP